MTVCVGGDLGGLDSIIKRLRPPHPKHSVKTSFVSLKAARLSAVVKHLGRARHSLRKLARSFPVQVIARHAGNAVTASVSSS